MKKLICYLLVYLFCQLIPFNAYAIIVGYSRVFGGGGTPDPTDQLQGELVYAIGTTATELDNEGTITVLSNIATYSIAFPTNVGVGCVVQYDADNSGTIDDGEYGIIRGISTDRTKAYLLLKDKNNVTNTTATTSVYDIFRAYISLALWETNTGNTNVDPDISFELTDLDITGGAESGVLNVAGYADGNDSQITINGWTTNASNYINIYTPTESESVGVTQRHNGVSGGYTISLTGVANMLISDEFVRIDGIYFSHTGTSSCINIASVTAGSVFYITNNIIKSNDNSTGSGVYLNDADATFYVMNNVIYTWLQNKDNASTNSYWYNNTIYDCSGTGINEGGSGTTTAKNNLVFNNGDDMLSVTTADYNATDDGDGTNAVTITQSGSDYAALVNDAPNGDFTVTDASSELYHAGLDQTSDALIPSEDIAGTVRPAMSNPVSIGAFDNVP